MRIENIGHWEAFRRFDTNQDQKRRTDKSTSGAKQAMNKRHILITLAIYGSDGANTVCAAGQMQLNEQPAVGTIRVAKNWAFGSPSCVIFSFLHLRSGLFTSQLQDTHSERHRFLHTWMFARLNRRAKLDTCPPHPLPRAKLPSKHNLGTTVDFTSQTRPNAPPSPCFTPLPIPKPLSTSTYNLAASLRATQRGRLCGQSTTGTHFGSPQSCLSRLLASVIKA